MIELRGFNEQATPVFADLGDAAPEITGATRALGPLADAATPSLVTLGDSLEEATPDLVASEPVLRDVSRLANASSRPAKNLSKLLGDLREKGGYERLLSFLYRFSGSVNGMDRYGHFLRTQFLATNCTDYVTTPLSGCSSNFIQPSSSRAADTTGLSRAEREAAELPELDFEKWDPPEVDAPRPDPDSDGDKPQKPGDALEDIFGVGGELESSASTPPSAPASLRGADELFRFLMEPGP
jgi:hypothetical protein